MTAPQTITLQPITKSNWKECVNLSVAADQTKFVPDNLYSIAEAQFYPDAVPLAIYDDHQMVGFIMYGRDEQTHKWKIFRLMVEVTHQGKGYARAALQQVITEIARHPDSDEIIICYHNSNQAARNLYAQLGFREQTINDQGVVTALLFNSAKL